jgi:TP901 family phage tail tape measure protein
MAQIDVKLLVDVLLGLNKVDSKAFDNQVNKMVAATMKGMKLPPQVLPIDIEPGFNLDQFKTDIATELQRLSGIIEAAPTPAAKIEQWRKTLADDTATKRKKTYAQKGLDNAITPERQQAAKDAQALLVALSGNTNLDDLKAFGANVKDLGEFGDEKARARAMDLYSRWTASGFDLKKFEASEREIIARMQALIRRRLQAFKTASDQLAKGLIDGQKIISPQFDAFIATMERNVVAPGERAFRQAAKADVDERAGTAQTKEREKIEQAEKSARAARLEMLQRRAGLGDLATAGPQDKTTLQAYRTSIQQAIQEQNSLAKTHRNTTTVVEESLQKAINKAAIYIQELRKVEETLQRVSSKSLRREQEMANYLRTGTESGLEARRTIAQVGGVKQLQDPRQVQQQLKDEESVLRQRLQEARKAGDQVALSQAREALVQTQTLIKDVETQVRTLDRQRSGVDIERRQKQIAKLEESSLTATRDVLRRRREIGNLSKLEIVDQQKLLTYTESLKTALSEQRRLRQAHLTLSKEDVQARDAADKKIASYTKRLREAEQIQQRLNREQTKRPAVYDAGQQAVQRTGLGGTRHLGPDELPAANVYLKTRVRELSQEMEQLSRQGKQNTTQFRETSRSLIDHQQALSDTRARTEGLRGALHQMGLAFRLFVRYALEYGSLYAMLNAITALGKSVVSFQDKLKSVQAVSEATTRQINNISAAVRGLITSMETPFSTDELAKAAQVLSQAGVAPEKIAASLKSVAQYATATETTLETAADTITTMQDVFGKMGDARTADLLTKAINISKLTGEGLTTIVSRGAQTAREYGFTAEQFLAAAAVLRNAGLKESTIATNFRQAVIDLLSPDEKLTAVLQKRYRALGQQFTAPQIKARFLAYAQGGNPLEVLREYQRLGLGGSGAFDFKGAFANVEGENAIAALVSNLGELEEKLAALSSGGAAARGATTQMESLTKSFNNLKAVIVAVTSNLGGPMVETLERWTDGLTKLITKLDDVITRAKALGGPAGFMPVLQAAVGTGLAVTAGYKGSFAKKAAVFLGTTAVAAGAGTAATAAAPEESTGRALSLAGAVASIYASLNVLARNLRTTRIVPETTTETTPTSTSTQTNKPTSTASGGIFSRWFKSAQPAASAAATAGTAATMLGGAGESLAPVAAGAGRLSRMWGAAKLLGPRLAGFTGLIGLIIGIVTSILSLIDLFKEEDADTLADRVNSLEGEAEKKKAQLASIKDQFAQVDPGNEKGQTALVQTAQSNLEAVDNTLRKSFKVREDQIGEARTLLVQLAEQGTDAFGQTHKTLMSRLAKLTSFKEFDRGQDETLSKMAAQFRDSSRAVIGARDDLLKQLRFAVEHPIDEYNKALAAEADAIITNPDFNSPDLQVVSNAILQVYRRVFERSSGEAVENLREAEKRLRAEAAGREVERLMKLKGDELIKALSELQLTGVDEIERITRLIQEIDTRLQASADQAATYTGGRGARVANPNYLPPEQRTALEQSRSVLSGTADRLNFEIDQTNERLRADTQRWLEQLSVALKEDTSGELAKSMKVIFERYGKTFDVNKLPTVDELLEVMGGQAPSQVLPGGSRTQAPPVGRDFLPSKAQWQEAYQATRGATQASPESLQVIRGALVTSKKDRADKFSPEFAERLAKMIQAAPGKAEIYSGFRDYDEQVRIFQQVQAKRGAEARKWAAPPGLSQHNLGEAADMRFKSAETQKWFHENAKQFGLNFRMDHEGWHIERSDRPATRQVYRDTLGAAIPAVRAGAAPKIDTAKLNFNGADPEKIVQSIKVLQNLGLSLADAAAVAGNVVQENAKFDPNLTPDNGKSVGLFQHMGARQKGLGRTLESQLTHIVNEMTGRSEVRDRQSEVAYKLMQRAQSVEDKAVIFAKYVERAGDPQTQKRQMYAQNAYLLATQQGAQQAPAARERLAESSFLTTLKKTVTEASVLAANQRQADIDQLRRPFVEPVETMRQRELADIRVQSAVAKRDWVGLFGQGSSYLNPDTNLDDVRAQLVAPQSALADLAKVELRLAQERVDYAKRTQKRSENLPVSDEERRTLAENVVKAEIELEKTTRRLADQRLSQEAAYDRFVRERGPQALRLYPKPFVGAEVRSQIAEAEKKKDYTALLGPTPQPLDTQLGLDEVVKQLLQAKGLLGQIAREQLAIADANVQKAQARLTEYENTVKAVPSQANPATEAQRKNDVVQTISARESAIRKLAEQRLEIEDKRRRELVATNLETLAKEVEAAKRSYEFAAQGLYNTAEVEKHQETYIRLLERQADAQYEKDLLDNNNRELAQKEWQARKQLVENERRVFLANRIDREERRYQQGISTITQPEDIYRTGMGLEITPERRREQIVSEQLLTERSIQEKIRLRDEAIRTQGADSTAVINLNNRLRELGQRFAELSAESDRLNMSFTQALAEGFSADRLRDALRRNLGTMFDMAANIADEFGAATRRVADALGAAMFQTKQKTVSERSDSTEEWSVEPNTVGTVGPARGDIYTKGDTSRFKLRRTRQTTTSSSSPNAEGTAGTFEQIGRDLLSGISSQIYKGIFGSLAESILGGFTGKGGAKGQGGEPGVKEASEQAFTGIADTFKNGFGAVEKSVTGFLNGNNGFFSTLASVLIGGLGGIVNAVGGLFSGGGGIVNAVGGLFSGGGGSSGAGIFSSIVGLFARDGAVLNELPAGKPLGKFATGKVLDEVQVAAEPVLAKFAGGGLTRGVGGIIKGKGTPTSDSIPALLTQGRTVKGYIAVSTEEAILNAKATKMLGPDFINRVNRGALQGKFARGGMLSGAPSTSSQSGYNGSPVDVQIIDQRSASAPDMEVQRRKQPGGKEELRVFVREAMKSEFSSGSMDRTHAVNMGTRRPPIRR